MAPSRLLALTWIRTTLRLNVPRALVGAAIAALVLAAPASAALPRVGVLVPGRSLGGIRLGERPAAVRAQLGSFYGVCRGCETRTWYFTYRAFADEGLAVEFGHAGVSAVYTLWQPRRWHDTYGLVLGAAEGAVHLRGGPHLRSLSCEGYTVLVADTHTTRSAYYVLNGRLWGFGLFPAGASPCR
jgi:hypothetical protein